MDKYLRSRSISYKLLSDIYKTDRLILDYKIVAVYNIFDLLWFNPHIIKNVIYELLS